MLDLQTFVIPDNIMIKGHTIVIDGGVLIDGYSGIEYGIVAEVIAAGEHVEISGEVSSHSGFYDALCQSIHRSQRFLVFLLHPIPTILLLGESIYLVDALLKTNLPLCHQQNIPHQYERKYLA